MVSRLESLSVQGVYTLPKLAHTLMPKYFINQTKVQFQLGLVAK